MALRDRPEHLIAVPGGVTRKPGGSRAAPIESWTGAALGFVEPLVGAAAGAAAGVDDQEHDRSDDGDQDGADDQPTGAAPASRPVSLCLWLQRGH